MCVYIYIYIYICITIYMFIFMVKNEGMRVRGYEGTRV